MRKTVGQLAIEAEQKRPESLNPIELQRVLLDPKEYLKKLMDCVIESKKIHDGDIYVEVITKKEAVSNRVMRLYHVAHRACPTPTYDSAVYRYNAKEDQIEFLWVLPDKGTYFHLLENVNKVHPEEHGLLNFVIDDSNGILLRRAKKLNGEQDDSPLLEK